MSLRNKLQALEDSIGRMLLICDVLEGKGALSVNEKFVLDYMNGQANNLVATSLGQIEQVEQYYRYAVGKNQNPVQPKGVADIVLTDKAIQQKVTVADNPAEVKKALHKAMKQLAGDFGERAGDRRRAIQLYIYSEENPWPFDHLHIPTLANIRAAVESAVSNAAATAINKATTNSTLLPYLQGNRPASFLTVVTQSQTCSRLYGSQGNGFAEINTIEVKVRWLNGKLVTDNHLVKALYGFKVRAHLNTPTSIQSSSTKVYWENDEY
ncbi:hypothetical protein QYM18_19175 [Ectopseudomonas chengduensis]|nr:hypothetical protein [Pseudomonas chengduensis]WKC36559.1 hypothetical protein QYM18_19175 [Pseudomonas chengduensis]